MVGCREKVAVACDHAAVAAKRVVIEALEACGAEVEDLGVDSDASVDYPDYAAAVARSVVSGRAHRGVLLCGSGIGMSIAANKVAGVRAALVHDPWGAEMSRRHNDANILTLGAKCTEEGMLREVVRVWMETPFDGGRHQRRVGKISRLEQTAAKSGSSEGPE